MELNLQRDWANEDQLTYATEERDRIIDIWSRAVNGVVTWTVNEWVLEPLRASFGIREPQVQFTVPKTSGRTPISPIEKADVFVTLPFESVSLLPSLPESLQLHDYQRDAVNKWLRASWPWHICYGDWRWKNDNSAGSRLHRCRL